MHKSVHYPGDELWEAYMQPPTVLFNDIINLVPGEICS